MSIPDGLHIKLFFFICVKFFDGFALRSGWFVAHLKEFLLNTIVDKLYLTYPRNRRWLDYNIHPHKYRIEVLRCPFCMDIDRYGCHSRFPPSRFHCNYMGHNPTLHSHSQTNESIKIKQCEKITPQEIMVSISNRF